METIIVMIILGIISSLFSQNKKEKQKQKPMPPFSGQPSTKTSELPKTEERRPRSLEDFAKEVFQQLNEKENPIPKQVEEKQPTVELPSTSKKEEVSKPDVSNRPVFNENRTSNRSFLAKGREIRDSIKQREIGNVVPTNKEALIQAIIASEIIGPPKARQRR